MYEIAPDPYCYPGSGVLKNRLGIADQAALDAFEAMVTAQRAEEPLPGGRFGYAHYRAIHRHLFQDVFAWAGRPRTVRIAKVGSMFCYPERIDAEMRKLFAGLSADDYLRGLSAGAFARRAAHFLAELNAIHPFREGNGRTQLTYLILVAARWPSARLGANGRERDARRDGCEFHRKRRTACRLDPRNDRAMNDLVLAAARAPALVAAAELADMIPTIRLNPKANPAMRIPSA